MLHDQHRRRVAEVICQSPHARFEGFQLDEVAEDLCRLRLPAAAHNRNQNGRVNGGAIAALIDTAATATAWASNRVGPKTRGTTVSMAINYLSAGGDGDLVAEARVVRRGGSLTVTQVTVLDEAGGEVATALVTYKIDLARPE